MLSFATSLPKSDIRNHEITKITKSRNRDIEITKSVPSLQRREEELAIHLMGTGELLYTRISTVRALVMDTEDILALLTRSLLLAAISLLISRVLLSIDLRSH